MHIQIGTPSVIDSPSSNKKNRNLIGHEQKTKGRKHGHTKFNNKIQQIFFLP